MTEWWTYRPGDFLMFAPRTYWRLFELHNQAWWPAQPLLLVAGVAWLVWWMRCGAPALRVGAAALALALAFVGWAFMLQRYAPINWAASGFALGFFVAAAASAALASRSDLHAASLGRRRAAWSLCGSALVGCPMLAAAFGRPATQAEFFGLAPDPTVLMTLGLLVGLQANSALTRAVLAVLWVLVLTWCVVSAATLWTMGSAQGWVMFVSAAIAVASVRVSARHAARRQAY